MSRHPEPDAHSTGDPTSDPAARCAWRGRAVAAALGPGWSAHPGPPRGDDTLITMVGPDELELSMTFDRGSPDTGRITVGHVIPRSLIATRVGPRARITVAATKTHPQIGADIRRRLLPAATHDLDLARSAFATDIAIRNRLRDLVDRLRDAAGPGHHVHPANPFGQSATDDRTTVFMPRRGGDRHGICGRVDIPGRPPWTTLPPITVTLAVDDHADVVALVRYARALATDYAPVNPGPPVDRTTTDIPEGGDGDTAHLVVVDHDDHRV